MKNNFLLSLNLALKLFQNKSISVLAPSRSNGARLIGYPTAEQMFFRIGIIGALSRQRFAKKKPLRGERRGQLGKKLT